MSVIDTPSLQTAVAEAAIEYGDFVLIGDRLGIAQSDASEGEDFTYVIDHATWLAKVPEGTVSADLLYIADSSTTPVTITRSRVNAPIARAVTARDGAGRAQVLLLDVATAAGQTMSDREPSMGEDATFTIDLGDPDADPADGAIATHALNDGGSGWEVGDVFGVQGGGGSLAVGVVDTVDGGGAVLTYHLTDPGQLYSANSEGLVGAADSPSVGTGLLIDVLTVTPSNNILSGGFFTLLIGHDGITEETAHIPHSASRQDMLDAVKALVGESNAED